MNHKRVVHIDQHYISGLAENRQEVITAIYRKFFPRIKRYILKNTGKEADAADIFQEAMVAIFQRARKGNFVLSCPFEAYLLTICRNLWLNELKHRKRQEVTNQEANVYKDKSAQQLGGETLLDQERDRFFWQKFELLGRSCKDILKLSWSGIGMQQVAEQLEISYQYARKKKSECIGRLMELIKNDPAFAKLKHE